MNDFNTASERVTQQFLLLGLFFVPISTALMNTFAVLTLAGFSIIFAANPRIRAAMKSPAAIIALLLLGLFVLAMTWSITPYPKEIWNAMGKYSKLLFIPIGFGLALSDKNFARKALYWFVGGAGVSTLCSYFAWQGIMPASPQGWWSTGIPSNPVVFKNHITFGILVAFASLTCFCYFFFAPSRRMRILSVASGIFFLIPVIFLTQGRTGYVVFFVGLITLIILRARANWKIMGAGVIAILLLFGVFYTTSGNMRERATQTASEMQSYSELGAVTSSGVRLNFIRGGLALMADNPIFGSGTGSFQEGFARIAKRLWPVDHPFHEARHQPHSEVILIGVQLGVLGWILYFSLLGTLALAGSKNNSFEGHCLVMLCIIFAIVSLFNSLLWDTTEGLWFTLLAGCLYAQARKFKVDAYRGAVDVGT